MDLWSPFRWDIFLISVGVLIGSTIIVGAASTQVTLYTSLNLGSVIPVGSDLLKRILGPIVVVVGLSVTMIFTIVTVLYIDLKISRLQV